MRIHGLGLGHSPVTGCADIVWRTGWAGEPLKCLHADIPLNVAVRFIRRFGA